MKSFAICLTMIFATICIVSCVGQKPEIVKTAAPPLATTAAKADATGAAIGKAADRAAENIDGAAVEVNETAGVVTTQAETLRKATPAAELVAKVLDAQAGVLTNQVQPKLHTAKEAIADVKKDSASVTALAAEIKAADAAAKAMAKERDDAQAKMAALDKDLKRAQAAQAAAEKKAKDASDNAIRSSLRWVFLIGIGALIGGIFIAVKGSPGWGLSLAASGLAAMGISALVSKWLVEIEWGAAILLFITLGVLGWMFWTRNKAFLQTANIVEIAKQKLDPANLKTIFGDGAIPGLVHQIVDPIQSALYKAAVKAGLVKLAASPTSIATVLPAGNIPAGAPVSAPAAAPPAAPIAATTPTVLATGIGL